MLNSACKAGEAAKVGDGYTARLYSGRSGEDDKIILGNRRPG